MSDISCQNSDADSALVHHIDIALLRKVRCVQQEIIYFILHVDRRQQ